MVQIQTHSWQGGWGPQWWHQIVHGWPSTALHRVIQRVPTTPGGWQAVCRRLIHEWQGPCFKVGVSITAVSPGRRAGKDEWPQFKETAGATGKASLKGYGPRLKPHFCQGSPISPHNHLCLWPVTRLLFPAKLSEQVACMPLCFLLNHSSFLGACSLSPPLTRRGLPWLGCQ